jgi:hypothetical protein
MTWTLGIAAPFIVAGQFTALGMSQYVCARQQRVSAMAIDTYVLKELLEDELARMADGRVWTQVMQKRREDQTSRYDCDTSIVFERE